MTQQQRPRLTPEQVAEQQRLDAVPVESMGRIELLNELVRLNGATAQISAQISAAKADREVEEGGEYTDADWWRRVHSALRFKRARKVQVQTRLTIMSIETKERNVKVSEAEAGAVKPLSFFFMKAARDRLDSETYERLHIEASKRRDEAKALVGEGERQEAAGAN